MAKTIPVRAGERDRPHWLPWSAFPDAEVVLLDTGHFALEEEADTIATAVDTFFSKHLG